MSLWTTPEQIRLRMDSFCRTIATFFWPITSQTHRAVAILPISLPRRLAQLSLNVQLGLKPRSALSRIAARALGVGRLLGDVDVQYRIGQYEIDIPSSHALPFYQHAFPLYDTAIGRLAELVSKKYLSSSIIDVGANVGDTAAAIRSRTTAPILCIEGNPAFSRLLDSNVLKLGKDIFVERTMIGPSSGKAPGKVISENGTAHIAPATSGEDAIDFSTLTDVLARHIHLLPPRLLKIDTDGYDVPILLGSADVLRASQPVVFFEFCPDYYDELHTERVWELLTSLGYERAIELCNTGEYEGEMDIRSGTSRRDLRLRYLGSGVHRYADIAVFSVSDFDISEAFRLGEAEATLESRRASLRQCATIH